MIRDYGDLYETHAANASSPLDAVGSADPARFEQLGRIVIALLKAEGLEPSSSLLDFGCGVGRLALHSIPYLTSGRYVGVDISPTMIRHARQLVRERLPHVDPQRYSLDVVANEQVPTIEGGYDFVCAFSVFTHIENEDTLRCLQRFAQVLRCGGRAVCSVLPLETELAKVTLLAEAALSHVERWNRVRNVTTSYSLMEETARIAGFAICKWYRGDAFKVRLDDGTLDGFRQSVLVLEKP